MVAFIGMTVSGGAGGIGAALEAAAVALAVALVASVADEPAAEGAPVAEADPAFAGAVSLLPPPHAKARTPDPPSAKTMTH
jgi:hypothetical protein